VFYDLGFVVEELLHYFASFAVIVIVTVLCCAVLLCSFEFWISGEHWRTDECVHDHFWRALLQSS
jgi:hypothetical protein